MSKKDLTSFCRESQDIHKQVSEREFRESWCRRCRNQECQFSNWGESAWQNRIDTQVGYLLDNPLFADIREEAFRHLAVMPFDDMAKQAEAIKIAVDNWEIPPHFHETESIEIVEDKSPVLVEEPKVEKTKDPVKISKNSNYPPSKNTEIPDEGIVIGTDPLPPQSEDPWSIPSSLDKRVGVGSKVVMSRPPREDK